MVIFLARKSQTFITPTIQYYILYCMIYHTELYQHLLQAIFGYMAKHTRKLLSIYTHGPWFWFYDASMQAPGVDLMVAQRGGGGGGVLTPSPLISEISLVEL